MGVVVLLCVWHAASDSTPTAPAASRRAAPPDWAPVMALLATPPSRLRLISAWDRAAPRAMAATMPVPPPRSARTDEQVRAFRLQVLSDAMASALAHELDIPLPVAQLVCSLDRTCLVDPVALRREFGLPVPGTVEPTAASRLDAFA